jgi:hypothetical protein
MRLVSEKFRDSIPARGSYFTTPTLSRYLASKNKESDEISTMNSVHFILLNC